jgi:hypothetical protein
VGTPAQIIQIKWLKILTDKELPVGSPPSERQNGNRLPNICGNLVEKSRLTNAPFEAAVVRSFKERYSAWTQPTIVADGLLRTAVVGNQGLPNGMYRRKLAEDIRNVK